MCNSVPWGLPSAWGKKRKSQGARLEAVRRAVFHFLCQHARGPDSHSFPSISSIMWCSHSFNIPNTIAISFYLTQRWLLISSSWWTWRHVCVAVIRRPLWAWAWSCRFIMAGLLPSIVLAHLLPELTSTQASPYTGVMLWLMLTREQPSAIRNSITTCFFNRFSVDIAISLSAVCTRHISGGWSSWLSLHYRLYIITCVPRLSGHSVMVTALKAKLLTCPSPNHISKHDGRKVVNNVIILKTT